ncbi:peptidyl-tRNA hydrolase [Candidatus Micrarchaeota archaeon]|nr:peptidyl-tRNA hydrolase [Candidatus Micrarchaeota archaeon]
MKQVIVLRKDLDMGKGKLVAQGAHASIESFLQAFQKKQDWVAEWFFQGQTKVCLKVDNEKELFSVFSAAQKKKLPCSLIHDAGRTQIKAGSATAVAIGPAPDDKIDEITGKLKLL